MQNFVHGMPFDPIPIDVYDKQCMIYVIIGIDRDTLLVIVVGVGKHDSTINPGTLNRHAKPTSIATQLW